MQKRILGVHHLAFAGSLTDSPDDIGKLEDASIIASEAGAVLFEIACAPIMRMYPKNVATALKNGGIHQAAFCRFFPDESFGNPVGENNVAALNTFKCDLRFIEALEENGIRVPYITGPGCFLLGSKNSMNRVETRTRILRWYRDIGELISGKNLTVAVEYLRPGEDNGYLESMREICFILDILKNPQIGVHGDVFHMLERGENPAGVIEMAGSHLKYLHAHGSGRLSPGAYNGDLPIETDNANWYQIGCALDHIGYQGPVVPEPFGQPIRDEIAALGEGLPPAIAPEEYYKQGFSHLRNMGVIQ